MAFLIKIALVSLLARSSFALPSPTSDGETLMARTVCSSNIIATFDDRDPPISIPAVQLLSQLPATGNLNVVPTPYKQLDWNGGFRLFDGIAIFDGVTQLLREARISIYDTVQSFTLKSLYVAGYIQSQGAALVEAPFTLTAIGTKTNGQTVSKDFNYTPGGLKPFKLPNSFTGLKTVVFKTNLLTTLLTAVIFDNVEYTVYTC